MMSLRPATPRAFTAVFASVIAGLALAVSGGGARASLPDNVRSINSCPGATVTGSLAQHHNQLPGRFYQFWGIPYAAPPTGANRWQPPQPHCWTGNIDGFAQKPACPQGSGQFNNEDCLHLNVFEPNSTAPAGGRAVMVYIHGGGLTSGSGAFQTNPIALLRKNVVVVTINYRIGALGFLAHSALDNVATGNTGNYGLLDQRAALQWVKANISTFGGDPNNVTVFGGSAGALSILTHLVSPLSAGLFEKAIIQSGAFGIRGLSTLAGAETQGASFASQVGCSSGTATQIADCLRALPVSTILSKQNVIGSSVALIKIDNHVLPSGIRERLIAGQFHDVPIINGSNLDEERFHLATNTGLGTGGSCAFNSNLAPADKATFPSAVSYPVALANSLNGTGIDPAVVEAQYPSGTEFLSANLAYTKVQTDRRWACRFHAVNDWIAAAGGQLYAYEFRDRGAPQVLRAKITLHNGRIFPDGAYHGANEQYLFRLNVNEQTLCNQHYPGLSAEQLQLADHMVNYWTNFAKRGNPNNLAVSPAWPKYTSTNRSLIALEATATGPRKMSATAFDTYHKCSSFWFTL